MSDTETTTTTTTSLKEELVVDSGYRSTLGRPLKLVQLLLEAACVGVVGYYLEKDYIPYNARTPKLFFQLLAVASLIAIISSFCLLLSFFFFFCSSKMSKTLCRVTSYGSALCLFIFVLLFVWTAMLQVNHIKSHSCKCNEPFLSPLAMGLVTSGLFICGCFLVDRIFTWDLNKLMIFI